MSFPTFPAEAFAGMAFAGIFCIVLPIAAAVIWKIKNKQLKVLFPVIIGAAAFFVFAMVLEQLLHSVMLPLVMNNAVLYSVYGCLAAGIFEETARLLAFKLVLKKHISDGDPRHAISYGIGHGGIEAVLLISLNMFSFMAIGITVNSGNTELLTAGMPESDIPVLTAQLEAFASQGFGMYLISCLERISAMTAHICFSVIVFAAVTRKKYWLYPAAILAHALFNVLAVLYQTGVITNISVVEIILALCAAALVLIVSRLYRSMKTECESDSA